MTADPGRAGGGGYGVEYKAHPWLMSHCCHAGFLRLNALTFWNLQSSLANINSALSIIGCSDSLGEPYLQT